MSDLPENSHHTPSSSNADARQHPLAARRRRLLTRTVSGIAAAVLVLAGGALFASHQHGASGLVTNAQASDAKSVTPPAADVDVAQVVARQVIDWQSYSGRLEAVDHVDVRPLVSGTIVAVHFQDGAIVKKGAPLFTIDQRPYIAALDHATAELASAKARAGWTASDQARAQRLIADNAIARRDFDEKQNAAREAAAGVQAAQAQLETARINLGYTTILSPVAGRVSRAELTEGNIVTAGTSAPLLTTVVSVSPIYAAFDVDEQTYLRYLRHDDSTKGSQPAPVAIGLANESGYSRAGHLASIDNQLDIRSGTIRVRASIDNTDGSLVPGLYARVRVGGGAAHPAVMVDDAAIGTDQDRQYVMVVDANNRAKYRTVTPGNQQDGLRVITAGLAPGERIIINGLQRVRPDDIVHPHEVAMHGDTGAGTDLSALDNPATGPTDPAAAPLKTAVTAPVASHPARTSAS